MSTRGCLWTDVCGNSNKLFVDSAYPLSPPRSTSRAAAAKQCRLRRVGCCVRRLLQWMPRHRSHLELCWPLALHHVHPLEIAHHVPKPRGCHLAYQWIGTGDRSDLHSQCGQKRKRVSKQLAKKKANHTESGILSRKARVRSGGAHECPQNIGTCFPRCQRCTQCELRLAHFFSPCSSSRVELCSTHCFSTERTFREKFKLLTSGVSKRSVESLSADLGARYRQHWHQPTNSS